MNLYFDDFAPTMTMVGHNQLPWQKDRTPQKEYAAWHLLIWHVYQHVANSLQVVCIPSCTIPTKVRSKTTVSYLNSYGVRDLLVYGSLVVGGRERAILEVASQLAHGSGLR